MKKSELASYLSKLGKKGGKARAKKLTAKRRSEIASNAGKKSAELRKMRKIWKKEGYV